MTKLKIAVTDYTFENLNIEKKVLSKNPNIEIIEGQARTEEEVIDLTSEVDGIINQYAPITTKVLKQLNKCKIISCYGIGVDTVNITTANEKEIAVANVPDYCIDEVADHSLSLLLNCAREVFFLNQYVKNKGWAIKQPLPIRRFNTQIVGVLGFGKIPRNLIEKLVAIGFNILVYDPFVSAEEIESSYAQSCSLEYIFQYSDFISIHIPLTNKTKGLINQNILKLAKPSLIIINTSRGEVINEGDLIEALLSKKIRGAALDVTEKEPVQPDNPLLKLNNVILTPHVAWYSEESQEELRVKCANNILEFFNGTLPAYLINRGLYN